MDKYLYFIADAMTDLVKRAKLGPSTVQYTSLVQDASSPEINEAVSFVMHMSDGRRYQVKLIKF